MKSILVSFSLFLFSPLLAAADARLPDPLSFESVSQLMFGLLLVIALIFLLAWVFKRANVLPGQHSGMKVVASLPLGARERAVLVQCGDKQLLLGVAPGSVQLLAQFDEPVILPGPHSSGEFATKLAHFLQQRKGS